MIDTLAELYLLDDKILKKSKTLSKDSRRECGEMSERKERLIKKLKKELRKSRAEQRAE